LAGHQPQLFHPGVWLKDFALDWLARRHGGLAVNLLVDSDTLRSSALRVPGGSAGEPQVVSIPYDLAGPPVPYEERPVLDRRLLADFGGRAAAQVRPIVADPLLADYWPMVLSRLEAVDNLGLCLAQSRHQLERCWGLRTWEVPQSRVCETESFAWFAAHLLAQLPRLRAVYNEVVQAYRRAHRIRSPAHPVPDLAEEDGWLESPFWIWTAENPCRRRLFARQRGGCVALSDRQGLEVCLPLGPDADAGRAVARLAELARSGVKIRSRALLTTLWARLALGDVFVHGIGGAKYDQVTDALMQGFFGLAPPAYMVVSGTLYLRSPHRMHAAKHLRAIDQQVRELEYHPERFLGGSVRGQGADRDEAARLRSEKMAWIRTPASRGNGKRRWRAIRGINEALQPWVAEERSRLAARRQEAARAVRAESVLCWREYGFCLHAEKNLREFFAAVLPKSR